MNNKITIIIALVLLISINGVMGGDGRVVYTTPTSAVSGNISPDGNASSICSGNEVLLGNGTCTSTTPYLAAGSGNNDTFDEEYANNLYLPHTVDTDTNRSDAEILGVCTIYNDTDWVLAQSYLTSFTESDPHALSSIAGNDSLWLQDIDTNVSTICSGGEVLLGNTSCWDSINFFDDTTIANTNDGNASSICSGDEVLLGNGSCSDTTPYLAGGGGDNVTWNEAYANNLYLPHTVDTDTNVSTICSGGEVLLGNTSCWDSINFFDDTTIANTNDGNASSICSNGEVLLGNGTCWDAANFFDDTTIADTDTNLTEAHVEAFIFDDDNELNFNMTQKNITDVDCIIFKNGVPWCTGT